METLFGLDYRVIWFFVVLSLFTAYIITDGYDFGAGAWHLFFKQTESRRIALQAVGPVWSGNEVWLVVGGGTLFAGFPLAYSTLFSAMYLPLMIFLIVLILRSVSIEFRNGVPEMKWIKTWDVVYGISNILLPVLLGVVLGNLLRGLPINSEYLYVGNGLLDFLNPYALLLGFTTLALVMVHGGILLMLKTKDLLFKELKRLVPWAIGGFIILFFIAMFYTIRDLPAITYRLNHQPIMYIIPIAAILCIANIPRLLSKKKYLRAFVFSSFTVAFLFGLVAIALYPNIIISTISPENTLSIYNSSSSIKSLKIMMIMVAIGAPLALIYINFIVRTFRGKIN